MSEDSFLHFSPHYGNVEFGPTEKYGYGWRVSTPCTSSTVFPWVFNDRDCLFQNAKECQLACDALNEALLTEEYLMELTDKDFGAIVTSRLRW